MHIEDDFSIIPLLDQDANPAEHLERNMSKIRAAKMGRRSWQRAPESGRKEKGQEPTIWNQASHAGGHPEKKDDSTSSRCRKGRSRHMAEIPDIENALKPAMLALAGIGRTCEVSAEDIAKWFEADTLYPDITLDEVLKNPWFVVHEIVEIDAIKKAGLVLTKDVIIAHPEEVDRAHCEAAKIELRIAAKNKDATHMRDRIPDIRRWSKDPQVLPEMRARYVQLCSETDQALRTIENEE